MNILRIWFQLPQWKQIIIGLIAGIFTGLTLKSHANIFLPIGTAFIHAIQMLVAPVVMTAIVCAVVSLTDFSKMGRIITKALLVYAFTMAISASIGIIIATKIGIGHDFPIVQAVAETSATKQLTLGEILISFIPTSPVAAFANNNVMQILCFAFLFGIAIRMAGNAAKPIKDIFLSLSDVVFLFAKIVVSFAPYGVFALIASVTAQYGMAILIPLLKFVGAVYLSCGILILIVFSTFLMINKINPFIFFKKITEPLITSYTTSSSAATLPVTMKCARENLKINRSVSDFLLPLGTTLNLNGLAIYLSVATIFAANMYGISLTTPQYISMVITIVFTAAGAAAIPSSGLIVMSAVMSSVGVPLAAIPIIAGVDRFNDMAQTMTNVTGDLFATTLVAKSEKMIEIDNQKVNLISNLHSEI